MKQSMARSSVANVPRLIARDQVKLCVLCGTLNYQDNAECWTCRWHGDFSRDEKTVGLAWRRLSAQYEEVRLEHLTSQKTRALGDFGTPRPRSRWQTLVDSVRTRWSKFQTWRDLNFAQRQARLRSRIPSRPDQLGV